MHVRSLARLVGLAVVTTCMAGAAGEAAPSRERLEYWRTAYRELTPTDDPRTARAHAIFQRVVQVAGTRPGVVPRLLIVATDPWDLALPIALPDGGIVLSKRTLDVSYQDPVRGDDRLAFVLAHELAHQLNDDFWHMRFFQALKASGAKTQLSPAFLDEMQQTPHTTQHILDRELKADERGILYAAMAGFDPQAIIADNPRVNFFADWVRALDPRRLGGAAVGQLRPTPEERAEALRAQLRRVADTAALFQLGLWFNYAGDYPRAIQAFEEFRAVFPAREVSHNLATSHHLLALQAYQAAQQALPAFPFQLPLTLDPLTRAGRVYLEGPTRGGVGEPAALFRRHLEEAIAGYRDALAQEASYPPAAVNLGCALILRGARAETRGLNADVSEAVTIVLRALERDPASPALLNTLGVALWYADRPAEAKEYLTRARASAPADDTPVFNLGQIARLERRDAQASEPLAPQGTPPPSARRDTEPIAGLAVGQIEDQVPPTWGAPARSRVQLGGRAWVVATYPTGIMTLNRDGEIRMILVREGFRGASVGGITIGRAAGDVLAQYGMPSRRVELTPGQNWAYDAHRLAFQLRDGRVVSWLVF